MGLLSFTQKCDFSKGFVVMCRFCPKSRLHLQDGVYILTQELEWWNRAPTCLVLCDWQVPSDPKIERLELMLEDALHWATRREMFPCLDLLWVVCGSCVISLRALCLSSTPDPQALLHAYCSSIVLYCWYHTSLLLWWTFKYKLYFVLLKFT